MKLIELKITNFLGIKAVNIKPDGSIIRIEGPNGAGKTSVIKGLFAALQGAAARPLNPIRNGQDQANIYVDLDDITITLKCETGKRDYLIVKSKDGMKGSQSTLNSLFTKLIDPSEFLRMTDKQRIETVLDITGQKNKIEEIENEYSRIYSARHDLGIEVTRLKGQVAALPDDDGRDVKEKSSGELLNKLNAAQALDREKENKIKTSAELLHSIETNTYLSKHNIGKINAIKERIEELKTKIQELESENIRIRTEIMDAEMKRDGLYDEIQSTPQSDAPAIQEEIEGLDRHNERVRAIIAGRKVKAELKAKQDEYGEKTNKLQEILLQKEDLINSSPLPIKDITIDSGKLWISKKPFDDLSDSERLIIGAKIGLSQNPKLRLLCINHGGEFTESTITKVQEYADSENCQVIIVRATDTPQDENGIFIVDGETTGPAEIHS